jgi:hypothetical protein
VQKKYDFTGDRKAFKKFMLVVAKVKFPEFNHEPVLAVRDSFLCQ